MTITCANTTANKASAKTAVTSTRAAPMRIAHMPATIANTTSATTAAKGTHASTTQTVPVTTAWEPKTRISATIVQKTSVTTEAQGTNARGVTTTIVGIGSAATQVCGIMAVVPIESARRDPQVAQA